MIMHGGFIRRIYSAYHTDQHILLGADEGLYTLNLNEIHENSMELVRLIYFKLQNVEDRF